MWSRAGNLAVAFRGFTPQVLYHSSLIGNVLELAPAMPLMQYAYALDMLRVILHEIAGGLFAANGRDAPEEPVHTAPFGQQLSGAPAMRLFAMPQDDGTQGLLLSGVVHALQIHQFGIAVGGENALHIQHIGHARRHASAEVLAGFTEHYHHTACHVFAGVRAH